MITINNAMELLTVSINEAYKENGEIWDKVLILRFPKAEFPFEEAIRITKEAETVIYVAKDKVFEYFVTEIIDKKENEYYTEIWVNNPETAVTNNLADKLSETEEMLDIITEGEETDESEN